MVSTFLRGDYGAPRPEPRDCAVARLGKDAENLILRPNHDNLGENARRREAATACANEVAKLFVACPNLEWNVVSVTHAELGDFRLLYYRTLWELARQSRTVREAAANVDVLAVRVGEGLKSRIAELELTFGGPTPPHHPPLIAVAPARTGPYVLLDGNTRAVARLRACSLDAEVEVLVGYDAGAPSWEFFGPL